MFFGWLLVGFFMFFGGFEVLKNLQKARHLCNPWHTLNIFQVFFFEDTLEILGFLLGNLGIFCFTGSCNDFVCI